MPHTWILESLELYKINRTLRAVVQNSMGLWKTNLEDNFRPPAEVTIKCGIYQGDALSPLLFCIGPNPLSQAFRRLVTDTGQEMVQSSATSSAWLKSA